jgi:hypothetical protein
MMRYIVLSWLFIQTTHTKDTNIFMHKNPRYQRFESLIHGGDILRGSPKNDLPWTLEASEFIDAQADVWSFTMLLIGLRNVGRLKEFGCEIQLLAVLPLTIRELNKFGFEGKRILDLLGTDQIQIRESKILEVTCELEKLDEICVEFKEAFLDRLQSLVPVASKQIQISKRIAEMRVGGFGAFCRLDQKSSLAGNRGANWK